MTCRVNPLIEGPKKNLHTQDHDLRSCGCAHSRGRSRSVHCWCPI